MVTTLAEQIEGAAPMKLLDVLTTARELGITGLPQAESLTRGRIWPSAGGWVVELGAGANVKAVGTSLYESLPDALDAAFAAIDEARSALVARLRMSDADAGRLAATSPTWESPRLDLWATPEQKQPWEVSSQGA